jgi:hypothetical protein
MTKAQELMKNIDELREELAGDKEKGIVGLIDQRRQIAEKLGPGSPTLIKLRDQIRLREDAIEEMLRQYWELMDEDADSARKEADGMAQSAVDRDVDGIKLLKELGYKGVEENVIAALVELKQDGYTLEKADVDVLEESIGLIRKHLTSVGIDVPFIDDCAAVAAQHIKDLRSSVSKLAIKKFNTTEERDHRQYEVEKTLCHACRHSVTSAVLYGGGWELTGVKLIHADDCVLKVVG